MPQRNQFRLLLLIFLAALPWSLLIGQTDELFKITRNKDANEIIYHLNTDEEGRLDQKTPIEAYWIRYDLEEEGRPLNYFERKFAYGLEFSDVNADGGSFQFVSFDRRLYLLRTGKRQFEVQAEIDGKRLKLEEVYLSLGGGSFWFPKVNFIELRLRNDKGERVLERIEEF